MVKKKTKGIKLNINISNRALYTIIAIAIILIASGFVIAYGSTVPSTMGHSLGEIELPACANGQVLKKVGTSWACGADNTGGIVRQGAFVSSTPLDQRTVPAGSQCATYFIGLANIGCGTVACEYNPATGIFSMYEDCGLHLTCGYVCFS